MTRQADILNDTNYRPVLDHGFVGLVDTMGSDADIVAAARVSYGSGTKQVNQDRGLIRYLISHAHSSPIEMGEIKLHVKCPIFVARQWFRHRTHSANEYSGRYSIMSDEFYRPTGDALKPQSTSNKQGRSGELTDKEQSAVEGMIDSAFTHSYDVYKALITPGSQLTEAEYDEFSDDFYGEHGVDDSYPGLARELARIVLPVANYTEFYWKQNLSNLLHLMKLRRDHHAQSEIRSYADAVFELVKPKFPLTIEAWEDYVWESRRESRMTISLMRELMEAGCSPKEKMAQLTEQHGDLKNLAAAHGMNDREIRDFMGFWLPSA